MPRYLRCAPIRTFPHTHTHSQTRISQFAMYVCMYIHIEPTVLPTPHLLARAISGMSSITFPRYCKSGSQRGQGGAMVRGPTRRGGCFRRLDYGTQHAFVPVAGRQAGWGGPFRSQKQMERTPISAMVTSQVRSDRSRLEISPDGVSWYTRLMRVMTDLPSLRSLALGCLSVRHGPSLRRCSPPTLPLHRGRTVYVVVVFAVCGR